MKGFPLWVLFGVLIWYCNAQIVVESDKTSHERKGGKIGAVFDFFQTAKTTDTTQSKPQKRSRRYSYELPWRKNEFTFSILKYTKDLPKRVQERILGKALKTWHKAAPQLKFTFSRNDPTADFKISFVKGDHGDAQAFDGSGPLIGHVFAPEDGRIHLDDDEWFTDKSRHGTNLLSAAVHEIGHALGMKHSSKKSAVMHKTYKKYRNKDIKLDSDDLQGIKALYNIEPSDRGNPSCKDKEHRTCVYYKKAGYCSPDYKDIMKDYCRFTCNLCDS